MILVFAVIAIVLVLLYFQDADWSLLIYHFIATRFGLIEQRFKGKTVWIVGASSGIGRLLAIELAKLKCKLILTATTESRLQSVKKVCLKNNELTEHDVLVLPLDISDESAQQAGWQQIVNHFGNIDILVNNAGRIFFSHFENDTMDSDLNLFTINTFANINLSRLVVRHWKQHDHPGLIVVTSSLAAYICIPFMQMYNASKRALIEYYNSIRFELAGTGIDVAIICPGPVDSELYEKSLIDPQLKLSPKSKSKVNTMSTSRCVDLMITAIAFRLRESWICKSSLILLAYFFCYCPFLTRNAFQLIMFDWVKRIMKQKMIKLQ